MRTDADSLLFPESREENYMALLGFFLCFLSPLSSFVLQIVSFPRARQRTDDKRQALLVKNEPVTPDLKGKKKR